ALKEILKDQPPPAAPLHGYSWDSPDGRFLAAPRELCDTVTPKVRVWRIDGDTPAPVFDDPAGVYEEGVAFRPAGRQVALGHAEGGVSVYDLETKERIHNLAPGRGPTFCLAYHPTLPRLAVGNGNEATVWDLDPVRQRGVMRQQGKVTNLSWHPRGHRLAV